MYPHTCHHWRSTTQLCSHTIHHHDHSSCHSVHYNLPSTDNRCRKEPDIHRNRVAGSHNHQLPMPGSSHNRLDSWCASNKHFPDHRHYFGVILHHGLPQQHHPRDPWPNFNCHLHCIGKPDRHRYQRSFHHHHRCSNHQCLHPRSSTHHSDNRLPCASTSDSISIRCTSLSF